MARRAAPDNRVVSYQMTWWEPGRASLDNFGLRLELGDGTEINLNLTQHRLLGMLEMLRAFKQVAYDAQTQSLIFGPAQPGQGRRNDDAS